jgi:hypothetical protein
MKKRLLTRLSLLGAVAVAGFFLIVWWTAPANVTTLERFRQVQGGETAEELEELLGSAGIEKPGVPPIFPGYVGIPDNTRVEFADIDAKFLPVGSSFTEWQTRQGKRIVVCFDESGRVAVAATIEQTESWWEKLRRWIR